jgi:hypothetical protein
MKEYRVLRVFWKSDFDREIEKSLNQQATPGWELKELITSARNAGRVSAVYLVFEKER